MTQENKIEYKASGVYILPTAPRWYGNDVGQISEEIVESGEIYEVGAPDDVVDDDQLFDEWVHKNVVELIMPVVADD